jgi:hypothetical protein
MQLLIQVDILEQSFGVLVPILAEQGLLRSSLFSCWCVVVRGNTDKWSIPLFCYARTKQNLKRDGYRWWFRSDQLTNSSWTFMSSRPQWRLNDETRIQSRENKLPHSYGLDLDSLQLIYPTGASVPTVLMAVLCPCLQRRIFVSTNRTVH